MVIRPIDLGKAYAAEVIRERTRQRCAALLARPILLLTRLWDLPLRIPSKTKKYKGHTGLTSRWIAQRIGWEADDVAQILRNIGSPTSRETADTIRTTIVWLVMWNLFLRSILVRLGLSFPEIPHAPILLPIALAFAIAVYGICHYYLRRQQCRRFLDTPLTASEAEDLTNSVSNTLPQQYGSLIGELIALPKLPAESEASLRQSLREMGGALARLSTEAVTSSRDASVARDEVMAQIVKVRTELSGDSLLLALRGQR